MLPLNRDGPALLLRKIKRWLEPDLDPRRVQKVFDQFDRIRRYEAWQTHCRLHLTRPLAATAGQGPVVAQGFVTLTVMAPALAAKLLAEVDRQHHSARLTHDSAKLEGYQLDDPALVLRLLETALTSTVWSSSAASTWSTGTPWRALWLARRRPRHHPAGTAMRGHARTSNCWSI